MAKLISREQAESVIKAISEKVKVRGLKEPIPPPSLSSIFKGRKRMEVQQVVAKVFQYYINYGTEKAIEQKRQP